MTAPSRKPVCLALCAFVTTIRCALSPSKATIATSLEPKNHLGCPIVEQTTGWDSQRILGEIFQDTPALFRPHLECAFQVSHPISPRIGKGAEFVKALRHVSQTADRDSQCTDSEILQSPAWRQKYPYNPTSPTPHSLCTHDPTSKLTPAWPFTYHPAWSLRVVLTAH